MTMDGVMDGNVSLFLYFVERGGVVQGILWRIGYHIVMTSPNVDGILEHIISSTQGVAIEPPSVKSLHV